ncbi:MAG: restriction endonuclease [Bacillota bacterium]
MALWLVRAGRHGEREGVALEKGVAAIGWDELPDLAKVSSKEELEELYKTHYPDEKKTTISNRVGQVWAFRERIKTGDLVVLPLKTRAAIAIGQVSGGYEFRPDLPEGARHTRPVKWLREDIPRTDFGQDLLYSFGAFMTVCQISRSRAEERVRALLKGDRGHDKASDEEEAEITDLEEYALDQIRDYIGRKFRGHELARLVNDLLVAQGYHTELSPAGADGGVDILAGKGAMGFDQPRLCVQVKSSDSPVDVSVFRELQGVMKNFDATQGLLVAWGGFKTSVSPLARTSFFEIRTWDSGDLVSNLLENYEQLSEQLQAELPLKRVWTLVREESD